MKKIHVENKVIKSSTHVKAYKATLRGNPAPNEDQWPRFRLSVVSKQIRLLYQRRGSVLKTYDFTKHILKKDFGFTTIFNNKFHIDYWEKELGVKGLVDGFHVLFSIGEVVYNWKTKQQKRDWYSTLTEKKYHTLLRKTSMVPSKAIIKYLSHPRIKYYTYRNIKAKATYKKLMRKQNIEICQ